MPTAASWWADPPQRCKLWQAAAWTFSREMHHEGGEHIFTAENVPDISDFALMVGDCVHNLRSALDCLVYELCRLRRVRYRRQHAFPIATDPAHAFGHILEVDARRDQIKCLGGQEGLDCIADDSGADGAELR